MVPALEMKAIEQRWRWQEAAGDQSHCAAGEDPKARSLNYNTLCSAQMLASAHCAWQVSFVEASGQFRTKLRFLPGRIIGKKQGLKSFKNRFSM